MSDSQPLISRLLEQARIALADHPDDARACALEACAHARASSEYRLLVRSLGVLTEAAQAAGDQVGASRARFDALALALATHDILGEHTALAAIQNSEFAVPAQPLKPETQKHETTDSVGLTRRIAEALGCEAPSAGVQTLNSEALKPATPCPQRRPLLEKTLEYTSSRATTQALQDGDYLLSIAALCRELGDGERCLEYSSRALLQYERTGNPAGRAAAYNNIADIYTRRGRYARAMEILQTALATLPQIASHQPPAHASLAALGLLTDAATLADDLPSARSTCDRLLPLLSGPDSTADHTLALLRKAQILLAADELLPAAQLLSDALPLTLVLNIPSVNANFQQAAAQLFAAQGQTELARTTYAVAILTLDNLDLRPQLARTLHAYGRLLIATGQTRQAIHQLQRAAELHRALEAGDQSLQIHHYVLQQDYQQDRRLLVLHSLSSLAAQLLPASDFATRSLSLLRQALRCPHATIYLPQTEQYLGDTPDHWGAQVPGEHLEQRLRMSDLAVSTRIIRLPLNLAGRTLATACLSRTSDQGLLLDPAFLETLANLLALGLANGLETDSVVTQTQGPVRQSPSRFPGIIGTSRRMRDVLSLVERVAPTPASVLIRGESGTGKELLARAIHERSGRTGPAFIAVNCAAIPEALLEAELFGIEKGTATGVAARIGKFELAHGGTLFLDEIGDMSLPLQAKLLRVLQSQSFERVGGRETLKVDVRVVAATNRDLEKAMTEEKFRQDLYYRLNVMTISLPPLRERLEDLPLLISHFLQKYNQEFGRQTSGISVEVAEVFRRYPWQGNVRELVNVLERAVILCPGETIQVEDLPVPLQDFAREHVGKLPAGEESAARGRWPVAGDRSSGGGEPDAGARSESPGDSWAGRKDTGDRAARELEQRLVAEALERCQGNIAKTARELGISRVQLYRLLDRHGLRPSREEKRR